MKQTDDHAMLRFPFFSSAHIVSTGGSWREGVVRIIYDGVLPAAVLILLTLTVNLMVAPVLVLFGPPGLLVYMLCVLAIGIYTLDRSIQLNSSEPRRIWCGALSGLLIWFVAESVLRSGNINLSSDVFFILIMMVSLVLMTIWKQVLPIGLKFFAIAFLCNWIAHFLLAYQMDMAGHFRVFDNTYRISGFIALAGIVFSFLWILKADNRVYRMWAAVGAWISVLIALMVFWGMPV